MDSVQISKRTFSLKLHRPRQLKRKTSKKLKTTISVDGSETKSTSASISTYGSTSTSASTSSWIRKKISPKKLKRKISKKFSRKSKVKDPVDSSLVFYNVEETEAKQSKKTTREDALDDYYTDLLNDGVGRNDDSKSDPVADTSHIDNAIPDCSMTAPKIVPVTETGSEIISKDNENPTHHKDSTFVLPLEKIIDEEEYEMETEVTTDLSSSSEEILHTEEVVPMMPIAEIVETCNDDIESSCSEVDRDSLYTASRDMEVILEEDVESNVKKTRTQSMFACCFGGEEIHKEGVIG